MALVNWHFDSHTCFVKYIEIEIIDYVIYFVQLFVYIFTFYFFPKKKFDENKTKQSLKRRISLLFLIKL